MRVINLALPLALPVQHSNPVIWQIFFCHIFAHFPQLTHLTQYLLTQLVVKNDVLLSIRARALMESNRELQKEATNKRGNQKANMDNEQRLWHASLQQLLQCFATFSSEIQRESGGVVGGGASQQPLLCRMHAGCQTMIIQESKTEGDSSTAKYSVLPPVSFYLPLLLCLAAAAVLLLLLPLRRTLSLSVCIFAC